MAMARWVAELGDARKLACRGAHVRATVDLGVAAPSQAMQDTTSNWKEKLGDDRELKVGGIDAESKPKNMIREDEQRAVMQQESSLSSKLKSNNALWLDEHSSSRLCSRSSSTNDSNESTDAKEFESNDESSLLDEVLRMRVRQFASWETSNRWREARLAARTTNENVKACGVQMLDSVIRCWNCRADITAGRVCAECRRGVCKECEGDSKNFPYDESGTEIVCVECTRDTKVHSARLS